MRCARWVQEFPTNSPPLARPVMARTAHMCPCQVSGGVASGGGGAIRREPGRFRAGRQIKGDAPTSAPGPLRSLESADLRPGKGPEEALARALFLFCRFPDPGKGGSRK